LVFSLLLEAIEDVKKCAFGEKGMIDANGSKLTSFEGFFFFFFFTTRLTTFFPAPFFEGGLEPFGFLL